MWPAFQEPGRLSLPVLTRPMPYFVFGEAEAAGLTSRSVFIPSGFCGVVVLTGEEPGFGEPVGEGVGLVDGLADAGTVGLATTTGLFGAVLVFGSQAPNTATLAAKTVDKINDLLIVFLLKSRKTRTKRRPQHRHHSRTEVKRLSANDRTFCLPFAAPHQRCAR